jgi:hypothetical protein
MAVAVVIDPYLTSVAQGSRVKKGQKGTLTPSSWSQKLVIGIKLTSQNPLRRYPCCHTNVGVKNKLFESYRVI